MDSIFIVSRTSAAIPIWFVTAANYREMRERLDANERAYADAAGYQPKPGHTLILPGASGLGDILFGLEGADEPKDLFLPGRLAQQLPAGIYRFANEPHDTRLAALSLALGVYRFTRYRKAERCEFQLDLPQSLDRAELDRIVEAVTLARDLINTPANDMGPAELDDAARSLAARYGAAVRSVVGDELVKENLPLIHAVGRAAERAPRLIDLTCGDADRPRVTLVGKGVSSIQAASTSSPSRRCST